jgi:YfiR/HmsC-like
MTGKHIRASRFFHGTLGLVITWTVLTWTLIAAPWLHAQQSTPTENEVKSAYLYNFGKFVEWPAKATSGGEFFPICALADDSFGSTLETIIAGESINGKKVLVKRVAKPQDAVSCRILFISSSEQNQLKELLAVLDNTSVLTVSDMPQFSRRGGMIQFVVEANKVRFEVNLTSAERAGLTLSSQLLKVAINVKRGAQSGD